MNEKLFVGLCLGLIGLASVGCSSTTPGIVRAQAPPDGQAAPVIGTPENPCPECGCTDGSCCHCLACLACDPHHRYWWHYRRPDAANCCLDGGCGCCCLGNHSWPPCSTWGDYGPLVYPPNPTPGAIVQYPYYTCKGPDDFFYPPINTSGNR